MKTRHKTLLIMLVTISSLVLLGAIGGAAFIYLGFYDIAARHPHMEIVRKVLTKMKRESVITHARNLKVPELNDPRLIKRGLELYQMHCLACHGAPGINRARLGVGLNPNPPPLEKAAEEWTEAQIAWVITNGLKMAGMPAFGIGKKPGELWALTAFVVRMNNLSPAEYQQMLEALAGKIPDKDIEWTMPTSGWEMIKHGDPDKGKKLVKHYGCVSCHEIPGAPGPQGMTGPSLKEWSKRHYLAGTMMNRPNNLIPWIMHPRDIDPKTVMPNLNVGQEDATHIATYLYSLGKRTRR